MDEIPSTKEIDVQVAKELSALSIQERSKLYEAIHGVDPIVEENPDLIRERLLELDAELYGLLSTGNHEAYETARSENPGYVEDPKFRLQFLRADYFDTKKAARRLLEFMSWKLKLFGRECLSRRVRLEDLEDEGRRVVKSGSRQILPWRDRRDRAVIVGMNVVNGPPPPADPSHMIQALVYLVFCLAEDEETQRRGIVNVVLFFSPQDGKRLNARLLSPNYHKKAAEYAKRLPYWLPVRLNCSHHCVYTENSVFDSMMELLRHSLKGDFRSRLRVHKGSPQECGYALSQYGIRFDHIPLKADAEHVKRENHVKLLKRRKQVDSMLKENKSLEEIQSSLGLELPGKRDVLLGRARIFHQYDGNVAMRGLVEELMGLYIANSIRLPEYARMVFRTIQNNGGRFLEKDTESGWWRPVSTAVAEAKVVSAFRTSLSRRRKQSETGTAPLRGGGNKNVGTVASLSRLSVPPPSAGMEVCCSSLSSRKRPRTGEIFLEDVQTGSS